MWATLDRALGWTSAEISMRNRLTRSQGGLPERTSIYLDDGYGRVHAAAESEQVVVGRWPPGALGDGERYRTPVLTRPRSSEERLPELIFGICAEKNNVLRRNGGDS